MAIDLKIQKSRVSGMEECGIDYLSNPFVQGVDKDVNPVPLP